MQVVLQRRVDDCEVAAIATACNLTYEQVYRAEGRKELPGMLNDPVWGNPETLYLTLIRLGFWKRNITWEMLTNRKATPGKTIILIHALNDPNFSQHYIVLESYAPGGFNCYWGTQEAPVFVGVERMKALYLGGWPNCAFEVIKDTVWNRFKRWIGLEK